MLLEVGYQVHRDLLLVFLEDLLQQPVDLVTEQALREELRPAVEADAITL